MARDRTTRLARRARVVRAARRQDGVLTTSQLHALGVTEGMVAAEMAGQRWQALGRETVRVAAADARADWWAAVLTCSPRVPVTGACTAALGGLTALLAAGLDGIGGDGLLHVAAPKSSRPLRPLPGVRIHETRRWRDEDIVADPVPRARTAVAAVQAALWARTDREAALLLVAPVQQRLTSADAVRDALDRVRRDRRRLLLRGLVRELEDGVGSLNELDFAAFCRARGLPEPSRQVVRHTSRGRAYLDVRWDRWHVVVEVDGVGHLRMDRWLDDTARHNELALTGDLVLRIPSLGLRLDPNAQLDVVERALRGAGWRP